MTPYPIIKANLADLRDASTTLGGGSASGSLARFELSAQARRRSEDLTPAASTTSERSAMLAGPSVDGAGRASTVPVAAVACKAARARLRQQRRLEVDKTRKRAAFKRGASQAPRWQTIRETLFPFLRTYSVPFTPYFTFFFRGRHLYLSIYLPLTVVNWGSILSRKGRSRPFLITEEET